MNKLSQLDKILKETETKYEFNIIEDLKSLIISFGVLKSKDFRKKLEAVLMKYENHELTEIRKVVLSKCQQGDTQAIKIYAEYFKPETIIEVDDGLIEALTTAGKEVWTDEI